MVHGNFSSGVKRKKMKHGNHFIEKVLFPHYFWAHIDSANSRAGFNFQTEENSHGLLAENQQTIISPVYY